MSFSQFAVQLAEISRECYARGWALDTTTGAKREPESYTRIAAALERSPSEVLFISDIGAELDAARTAVMRRALCVRGSGECAVCTQ
jgi:methionine salvage enolase-phosphatase E1